MPDSDPADLDDVLAELTLEEKALAHAGLRLLAHRRRSSGWASADHGLRRSRTGCGPSRSGGAITSASAGSVPATCFPTASGPGVARGTPSLFSEVGQALAREARAGGVSVVLGPGINIKRSPLCGRNFEYLVRGPLPRRRAGHRRPCRALQSLGIGTSVKHYAANNQETDRLRVSAEVDERTLREIYLPAFEAVVKHAQPWTVMCAYNKVNGTYASEHHWLLTEVLRDEWGFEGLVVSDWGAVHDRVAALAAGLDLEMPPALGYSRDAVVARGPRRLASTRRCSTPPYAACCGWSCSPGRRRAEGGTFDVDEHHRAGPTGRALESAVLLKNDGNVLPLRPAAGSTVAVIGEFARTPRFQGAGSSQVNPTRIDVLLDELTAPARRRGRPSTSRAGFGLDSADADDALVEEAVPGGRATPTMSWSSSGCPARPSPRASTGPTWTCRPTSSPCSTALAAVHDRLVVVLVNGSTVQMSTWDHHAAAVLNCWLSGQAAGGAVADLLHGRGQPVRQAGRDHPAPAGRQLRPTLNFPGDSGSGALRRGAVHRLPQLRQGRARRQPSVRLRAVLHDVRVWPTSTYASAGSVEGGDLAVSVAVSVTNTGSAGRRRGGAGLRRRPGGRASPARCGSSRRSPRWAGARGDPAGRPSSLDERSFAFWSVRPPPLGGRGRRLRDRRRDLVPRPAADRDVTLDAPSIAAPLDRGLDAARVAGRRAGPPAAAGAERAAARRRPPGLGDRHHADDHAGRLRHGHRLPHAGPADGRIVSVGRRPSDDPR